MWYEKQADKKSHFIFGKYTENKCPKYPSLPHFHSSIEMYLVTRGEYDVYVNGERRRLCAGDMCYVDSFSAHCSGSVENCRDFEVYVLVVSTDYYSPTEQMSEGVLPPFFRTERGYGNIRELVEWGYSLRESMSERMREAFVALLIETMQSYVATVARSGEGGKELTAKLMQYVCDHSAEEISLDMLADKFGYERTYISRVLNRTLGMNIREYLNRLRISNVKHKRESAPEIPLYIIAQECGFKSENTFYRALKKYGQEK